MALYKISSSRVNNIEADEYSGSIVEQGLIWYDPDTGILRLYNGQPGGYVINTGSGNVESQLVNGRSNVIVYPNGNVAISVNGTSNVAVFSNPIANFGNLIATGNVTANEFIGNGAILTDVSAGQISATGNVTGNYFIGNGALLTGIASDYGNANVAAFLPTYTGTLSGSAANISGNITGNYFIGNGALLTGVVATEIGTLTTLSVTGNITTGNLQSLGTVSALGNVTGNYFIGNGALLTGIGGSNALPSQYGQAGKYLTTDGDAASWNDALGGSLTFTGGTSIADQGTELSGGSATSIADNAIEGGRAASNYNLTLAAIALTGQFEDLVGLDEPPPGQANSTGTLGQLAFDNNWLYICVGTNTWRRAALQSW